MKELEEKPFGRWASATREYRDNATKKARESWKNPTIRQHRIDGMKKYYANKFDSKKHSKIMKNVWRKKK